MKYGMIEILAYMAYTDFSHLFEGNIQERNTILRVWSL